MMNDLSRSSKFLLGLCFLSYAFSFAFPLLCTILTMNSGLSAIAVGWVISGAFLGSAVIQPIVGRWLDQGLDGRVLKLSAISFLLGIAGIHYSSELRYLLIPALVVFVASFSSIATASSRIIEGMASQKVRGKAALFFAASVNLGFGVSSTLAFYFLKSHQPVLLALDAVTTLGYIIAIYVLRPETAPTTTAKVAAATDAIMPTDRRISALAGILFIFISKAACLSAIPMLYARLELGSEQLSPVMFGTSNLVVAGLGIGCASAINRLRTRQLLLFSTFLFAVGHALVPLVNSQLTNILVSVIWGVGEVFAYPLASRVVFGCYSASEAGRGAATKSSLMRVAMAIAPAIGALIGGFPPLVFSLTFGLIPLLGMFLVGRAIRFIPEATESEPKRPIQSWVLEQFKRGVLVFLTLSISIILITSSVLVISDKVHQLVDANHSFLNSQIPNLQIFDFVRMNSDLEVFARNKPITNVRILGPSGIEIGQWSSSSPSNRSADAMMSLSLGRSGQDHLDWRRVQDDYQFVLSSALPPARGHSGAVIELTLSLLSLSRSFLVALFGLIGIAAVTYIIGLFLSRRAARVASQPIERLSNVFQNAKNYDDLETASIPTELIEVSILMDHFRSLSRRLKQEEENRIEYEKLRATGLLAAQVAHDIRSPLAALDVVMTTTSGMPEEKRMLVRSAISRIKDIANDMLSQHKPEGLKTTCAQKESDPHLISTLLEQIVSEKRLQYRHLLGVEIEEQFSDLSYGIFASIQPSEFQRIISNLVNNSVEAFPEQHGKIFVNLTGDSDWLACEVKDNGKGISADVLASLGEVGASYGKTETDGGFGLGLAHAIKTVQGWHGILEIESQPNVGTTVRIKLPRAATPSWFLANLTIRPLSHIVVVDDDSSIHRIWRERLKRFEADANGIRISHFSCPKLFANWLASQRPSATTKFLIDYEFIEADQNGLDLIESLQIADRAVLVTSRYQEVDVAVRAEKLGVPIIPKGLAGLVPIAVAAAPPACDAILIDDDDLIHQAWKLWASENKKRVDCFFSVPDFLEKTANYNKQTPIFVDSDLGVEEPGEIMSRAIHALGFTEIYLATGREPSEFSALPHLKGVVGKAAFLC